MLQKKVLIDTSLYDHASCFTGVLKKSKITWCGLDSETEYIASEFSGAEIKSTKGGDQNGAMGAIAKWFMDNDKKAFETDAIRIERENLPNDKARPYNLGDVNLFKRVRLESISTLPQRPETVSLGIFGAPEESKEIFRNFLNDCENEEYRSIKSALGEKSSQDAWHLYCCLEHELDYFLTTDTKLVGRIKNMTNSPTQQKLSDIVRLPTQLCDDIGIHPLSNTELHNLALETGALFHVSGGY
jgi:hypothetical protein